MYFMYSILSTMKSIKGTYAFICTLCIIRTNGINFTKLIWLNFTAMILSICLLEDFAPTRSTVKKV